MIGIEWGGGGRLIQQIQHTSAGFMLSAGVSERGEKTGDPIQAQLIMIQGATPTLE
jgi:hypothetical protein